VDFHPRYGFTFPQSVNGTFICKSEDIEHQESLITVIAIQNPITSYSRSTEFVSNIVSVECESKGVVEGRVKESKFHRYRTFNGTYIREKGTKLDAEGKWVSSYELVVDEPANVNVTCVDENLELIWTKQLEFVRK
jgi:hypothetical protein